MNSARSLYSTSSLGFRNKQNLCNMRYQLQKSFNYTSNVMFLLFFNSLKNIPEVLKRHSVKIVQNCVQSCEYVLAHRIRRSHKMLCLYSTLWGEIPLYQFVRRLKAQLQKRKHLLLLGSGFVSAYDWNKERIPDEDILKYSAEMSLVEFLRDKRKACLKGNSRPADCTCSVGSAAKKPHTHTLYKTHMSRGDIGIEPAQTPPQKEELPSVNFFKMKNQTKCLSPQWLKNYKPETLKSAEGKTKKIQLEARNPSKSSVGTKKKTGTLIRKKEQR
ncbi:StAR- lipid transfer protein 7, mitochondrial [Homalodisca vitripennis]|nr:StAR- lipid transfer protein 7, mitochondrial [Homalodisca vitripennis]